MKMCGVAQSPAFSASFLPGQRHFPRWLCHCHRARCWMEWKVSCFLESSLLSLRNSFAVFPFGVGVSFSRDVAESQFSSSCMGPNVWAYSLHRESQVEE